MLDRDGIGCRLVRGVVERRMFGFRTLVRLMGRRSLPGPFSALAAKVYHSPTSVTAPPSAVKTTRAAGRLSRLPVKYRLVIALPILACGIAFASLAGMMVFYTVAVPDPQIIRHKERAPVVRILARDGTMLAERGEGNDYMPIELLPRHLQAAVVAIEDRRFFEHYGLDQVGLFRAFFRNLRAGRFAQGGSTLTQQLAKNLFLSSDRKLSRKIEELGLALWLEMRLNKSEILELYLNRVYFGGGAYGVEAASQRYFGKSARDLSLAEAALIAGLLKAPSKYSPSSSRDMAQERGRVVLAKMVEAGFITRADQLKASQERIAFVAPKITKVRTSADYIVDFVLEQMPPLVSGGHAEVIVETTLDAELQRQATEIVANGLARQGESLNASQAALVVLDNDGGIRAMVGGRNYADSQFNRAVKAKRQPGSAFKPFVYLAALEAGMSPDHFVMDMPLTIGNWSPRNDNGQYVGEITLRRALAQSVNTVAVRLIEHVGVANVMAVARRLGITSDLRDDPSLALGTSEVSLLEMSGAYAVFGNGGMAVDPYIVRRVHLSSGVEIFKREAKATHRVVDALKVGALNDMLNGAIVSGTGRRAALADFPAAGKTGTTQDFRDAWFVGYTSYFTAGVWIGNDNSAPMKKSVGGGLPAEMWRQVMQVAHRDKAPQTLPETRPGDARAIAGQAVGPRVAQKGEVLPWFSGRDTAIAASRAPVRSADARYPREPIDANFIADALSELPETADKKAEGSQSLLSFSRWW